MFDLRVYIKRFYNGHQGTFGKLYLSDEFVGYSLEPSNLDGLRNHAILPGLYSFTLEYSPKFHKILPLLSVPNRSGILVHSGNFKGHSRGCILVGYSYDIHKGMLYDSRACLDYLVSSLQCERGYSTIVVLNEFVNYSPKLKTC